MLGSDLTMTLEDNEPIPQFIRLTPVYGDKQVRPPFTPRARTYTFVRAEKAVHSKTVEVTYRRTR